MDKEACLRCGIDYEEGVSRFMGHAELYEKFLGKFPSDPGYPALEAAMAAKDLPAAFQAAHTLKGVSGNLSLTALYRALLPFVDALRGEGDLPLAESLYPAVQAAYRQAVAYIGAQPG